MPMNLATNDALFAEAANSVADGTRDAALEAARLSSDAKDVAAFNAGNALSGCSHHRCEVYFVMNDGSGLTNQSKGLEWRQAIARDVSEQLLKSASAAQNFNVSSTFATAGTAARP